jgi:hypothetical protein
MTSVVGDAALLQERFTRLGVSGSRNPNEDDQAYISTISSQAPPTIARVIVRQGMPFRNAPCECVQCLQQFRATATQMIHHKMYTKHISWKNAQIKCNTWVQEITSSQQLLRDAIKKKGKYNRQPVEKEKRDQTSCHVNRHIP